MTAKNKIVSLLRKADITVNGNRPTDIQVYDEQLYDRVAGGGSLALGESFMDKWWDVDDLASLVACVYKNNLHNELISFDALPLLLKAVVVNLQTKARSFQVGVEHYDIGNDLYTAMLDDRMVYTSAIWNDAKNLEEAQENKLRLLCEKMGLKAGDRVLDVGCGWGSFMKYAVEQYGVSCVGLTVSREQIALGKKLCTGLPIDFILTDYRDFADSEKFDHIVSVEMIEAVGPKNFRTYFSHLHSLLKSNGKLVIQTIGSHKPVPVADRWIDKYIFPNGILPSLSQLEKATRNLFLIDHLEDIGVEYDRTLMEWWRRFDVAYPKLSKENPKYDERFYRMWKFYLQACAGRFRVRHVSDWQIVFSPIKRKTD